MHKGGEPETELNRSKQLLYFDEDRLPREERLVLFDQTEASLVPTVLARDPDFQAKLRTIAGMPRSGRRKAAERVARDYVPNGRLAREMLVDLLLVGADEPWRRSGTTPVEFFGNLKRPAFWLEAELDELDAQRRKTRWLTLTQGALAFARFGAGRCLDCGDRLSGDALERPRRSHCRLHEKKLPSHERAAQIDARRQALNAWTGQRRRYRSARRTA